MDTAAGQQAIVDIGMFTTWSEALADEILGGGASSDLTKYQPDETKLSGFFYSRFRAEFLPAMEAWMDTDPLSNASAPKTPFVTNGSNGEPAYVLANALEADRLAQVADEKSAEALVANQNGDNYVLTMVLFASVLFFAGISSKLTVTRNRQIAVGVGSILLATGAIILGSLPILT